MGIKWQDKIDPSHVIRRIDETASIDPQGNVQFTGFEHFQYESVIHNMLSFPDDVPEREKRSIVSTALFAAAKKPPITPKGIIDESRRLLNAYNKRPKKPYILLTAVSLQHTVNLPTTRPRKCTVTFHVNPKLPFLIARENLLQEANEQLNYDLPDFYSYVRIHTKARSPYAAVDNALDALDLTRGILNWFDNRRHHFRISVGLPKAVNPILLGPYHTLHNLDGSKATDIWWYEPQYRKAYRTYSPQQYTPQFLRFFSQIREYLGKHPYRGKMEDIIIRYTRALDDHDYPSAFQKLWGVLEALTATLGNYDVTIKRTSFIYQEDLFHKQILQNLRVLRNQRVHQDESSDTMESHLYLLKKYVEDLMTFHVVRGSEFACFEDVMEFLDLPMDSKELRRKADLFISASEYRAPKAV